MAMGEDLTRPLMRQRSTEHIALAVLARLVRAEYPADRSVVEIADVWGDATADELDAPRAVGSLLDG